MGLIDLLESPNLWASLEKVFDSVRLESGWDERDGLEERISSDIEWPDELQSRLEAAFESEMIQRLPRPAIITATELSDIAIQQLAGLSDVAAGKARFMAFVDAAIRQGIESDYDLLQPGKGINLGAWRSDGEEWIQLGVLWPLDSITTDFRLIGRAIRVRSEYHVEAWLDGHCSYRAMNAQPWS